MSARFNFPKSIDDYLELQSQTTELRRQHRVRIALSKLCPRGATAETQEKVRTRYKTDAALIADAGQPSPASAESYRRTAQPFIDQAFQSGQDIWQMVTNRTGRSNTWYTRRAAVQHRLITLIGSAKNRIAARVKAHPLGLRSEEVRKSIMPDLGTLVAAANALDAMPIEGLPAKFREVTSRRVNSKSASIHRKPPDWREQIAATLKGNLKLAFLIQASTGCRSQEMVNGVTAMLLANGQLEFTIAGAKVSERAGQPSRSFKVATQVGGVVEMLGQLLKIGEPVQTGQLLVGATEQKAKDSYRKAVARASQRVFPPRKSGRGLSAYSLRHQFKQDVGKSASRETLAQAMGHSTTRSATHYGTGGKAGAGAVAPVDVKATRSVKARATIHAEATVKQDAAQSPKGATVPKPKL